MTNITFEEFWRVVLETSDTKYFHEVNCNGMTKTLFG